VISGVIFDMDGLMTDTERLYIDLWCRILREQGMEEHREVVTRCIGMDHGKMRAYIAETLGADFDYLSVLGEVGRRSEQYCQENGIPVKPGLYELLDYLDANRIPYAVATSSRGQGARSKLERIGVLSRLRGLVTGDMVEKGKPDPEIFVRAAQALKLPPKNCLVLEDSPHGILAAYKAGCLPMMIPDLWQPDEDIKALLYAQGNSLLDVIPVLKRQN
jgi:HAD superfamily hydrolase (TIGR01509 family)